MEDPVAVAEYFVVADGAIDTTLNLESENTAFSLKVSNGEAAFKLKLGLGRYEVERDLSDYLCSWEADMLFQNPSGPRRTFSLARLRMASGSTMAFTPTMTLRIVGERAEANRRRKLPWQYSRYASIPLVAGLIERYQAARCGRELLAVSGYFCLSALEQFAPRANASAREAFCTYFGIHRDVRSKLGDLVSSVGTFSTARKIDKHHDERELSEEERYWLETVLRLLIERAGGVICGDTPTPEITMAHLPALSHTA